MSIGGVDQAKAFLRERERGVVVEPLPGLLRGRTQRLRSKGFLTAEARVVSNRQVLDRDATSQHMRSLAMQPRASRRRRLGLEHLADQVVVKHITTGCVVE